MTNHPNRSRARFVTTGNEVTLTAENAWGEIETTTYFVTYGKNGGYVRIRDREGRNPQICDKLRTTGPTLWATASTLADVIRREYRLGRAADKRAEAC